MPDFFSLIFIILFLVFFFTPNKYLGLGGWSAGLLLTFIAMLCTQEHPFQEWLTWLSGGLGVAGLGVWVYEKSRASPSAKGDTNSQ